MAGSTHTQRRGWRPSVARSRTLAGMLESRRTAEADLRRAVYVRPYGRKWHIVRNICNDQEYAVADGLAFGRTFTEGTIVMLGSQSGRNGEFLISGPPAGGIGASGYAVTAAYRSVGPTPVETYTDGPALVSYSGGTLYTAWAAQPSDPEASPQLRIGSMTPEYLAMPPSAMLLGTQSALIPSASTLLQTVEPSQMDDNGFGDPQCFAVFGGIAFVCDGYNTVAVNVTTGSVVAVGTIALDYAPPVAGNTVVQGDKLFILEHGDRLHVLDWPTLENQATEYLPEPSKTHPFGIAPYGSSEVAVFRGGEFLSDERAVYRWRYNGSLTQTQGQTTYQLPLTGALTAARYGQNVVWDGTQYLVPTDFGTAGTRGYYGINAAHNGGATVASDVWPGGQHYPEWAWLATVPAGDPVDGTASEYPGLVRLVSNGTSLAFIEWVGDPPVPI